MIASEADLFEKAVYYLSKKFGPIDFKSPIFEFDQTNYYKKELGAHLKRQFLSFRNLIAPERLVSIKLFTNGIENKWSRTNHHRVINLDPGYISLSKLVLATTKNYSHRIYAGQGIFEEVTLYFKDSTFQTLDWTYPDYRTQNYISVFNEVRKKYYLQIEAKYGSSQLPNCL